MGDHDPCFHRIYRPAAPNNSGIAPGMVKVRSTVTHKLAVRQGADGAYPLNDWL